MKGIHVNWTKPYFHKHRLRGYGFESTRQLASKTYEQPDYQVLYTILSALHWKKNGPISLYTDSIGAAFYQQLGILDMYDEVNVKFLNGYSKTDVDPAYFWTSGKIKVLANQSEPFVFLDQDMIIRTKLPNYIFNKDITVAHWEIPRGYYYFDKERWDRDIKHVDWIENYHVDDLSPNTSFLYFKDPKIIKDYHALHKKLVNTNGEEVPEWFWLLTDQGILGHVIRQNDYKVQTLTDKIFLAGVNHGTPETRYKGISESWYYPAIDYKEYINEDKEDLDWYHVWIDKIHFKFVPEYKKAQIRGFFEEIVALGFEKYLQHPRFHKYWREYANN